MQSVQTRTSARSARIISIWLILVLPLTVAWPGLITKLLIYSTPFIAICAVGLTENKVVFRREPLFLYILAAILSIPHWNISNQFLFRDLLIVGGSFVTVAAQDDANDADVRLAFSALILATIVEMVVSPVAVSWKFDILNSEGPFESSFAITGGAFLIYFLVKRNLFWTIVSIIYLLITFKRISFVGVLAAGAVLLLLQVLRVKSITVWRSISLSILSLTWVAGIFGEQISYLLSRGALERFSVNQLSQGRYVFWAIINRASENVDLFARLFGSGPGSAQKVLLNRGIVVLPHNDFLKVRFEYGDIGQFVVLAAFAIVFCRTRLGCILLIYQSFVLLTDNSLIYLFHFICVGVICGASQDLEFVKAPRDPSLHGPRLGRSRWLPPRAV